MPKISMLLMFVFAEGLLVAGCACPQDQFALRVPDSQLVASAEAVRSRYAEEGEEMWKALAELVEPGMSVRQMLLVIPSGNDKVPATRRDVHVGRCVPGFDPAAFTVYYHLDGDFAVTGVGHGIQEEADWQTNSAGSSGPRWDKLILDRKPWVAKWETPTAPARPTPAH